MKKAMLAVVLFVMISATAVFAQDRKPEGAKEATVSELARFGTAVRAMDVATPIPTVQALGSRFAMVRTSGTPYDDVSLGITGIVHTLIPHGSLIGLRVRRNDGTVQIEGVTTWDRDLVPGEGLVVKSPGGALMFSSTKQYEVVVVDSHTLATMVDYIPVLTGSPFVLGTSFVVGSNAIYLRLVMQESPQTVNAVVINGVVVPQDALSVEPTRSDSSIMVNLSKFGVCFGSGDVAVTVVRGGQSDTTNVRFTSTLTCGPPTPSPKG